MKRDVNGLFNTKLSMTSNQKPQTHFSAAAVPGTVTEVQAGHLIAASGAGLWKSPRWIHLHEYETHAVTRVPTFKKPRPDLIPSLDHLELLPAGSLLSSYTASPASGARSVFSLAVHG